MNLKSYLAFFVVVALVLTLVAATLVGNNFGLLSDNSEPFSEFWLLDSDHSAENFPYSVRPGETYKIFVNLANHMGSSESYLVYVKLRNVSQYLQEFNSSNPSSSLPLYEFQFSVDDENVWESPVNFGFRDVFIEEDVLTVGEVTINGVVNPVSASINWTSETSGYYYQLFFELWQYNRELESFRFTNLSTGIWLNMTSS